MLKNIVLVFMLWVFTNAHAQELNIIPQPVKTQFNKGSFTITANTPILIADPGEKASADFLNLYLKQFYGFSLKTVSKSSGKSIRLSTRKFIKAPDNEGRYTLQANNSGISIQGDSYQGTFYGIQTLIQLLPVKPSSTLVIPAVDIEDYPRFSYRGLHLDVGRHFFPVDFVKKYIDYIALHKMNYFHWHLTEDQGWRIEIKKYPKLTEVGGCREGTLVGRRGRVTDSIRYCGFYTQEEIKDVVAYAAKRYITIIPEIELPGHSSAAIAAYPQLSCFPEETPKNVIQTWGVFKDVFCPTEYTFKFLEDVFDEVLALFPSKYIHIGGDESPKDFWKRSSFAQQLIKEKGMKDEHELQSYFIQRIEKYLNSKGRQIIGWDEILEGGLAPNATVMSWRGEEGGIAAAKENHNVIMTPGSHVYFDHAQIRNEDSINIGGFLPLDKVYSYEPVPAVLNEEQAKHILGAQANMWTEYMANTRKVEYMLFPRLSALSEVLWSPKEKRDLTSFEKRMSAQLKRYDLWKINYSKSYFTEKEKIKADPSVTPAARSTR